MPGNRRLSAPAQSRPGPTQPEASSLRAHGLALLPLALAGVLPLWQVALLCAVYALGVRSAEWATGRLLISLLVLALGLLAVWPALGGGGADLLRVGGAYLLQVLAAVALHLAAASIETGKRAGLLVPLALGLIAPHPLLLPALVGGALARPGADDRGVAWHARLDGAGRRWSLILLAGLTLAAALLPRDQSLWNSWLGTPAQISPISPQAAAPESAAPAAVPDDGLADAAPAQTEIRLPFQLGGRAPALPQELFLLAGLALVASGLLHWRRALRRAQPATLVERLMTAGLLLTGVGWLLSAFLLTRGAGSGTAGGPDADPEALPAGNPLAGLLGRFTSDRVIDVGPPLTVLMILSLLVLVGLVVLTLLIGRQEAAPVQAPLDPETPAEIGSPAAPLHRVRRAWLEAEDVLSAAGQGRADSETPAGFAARLGREVPELAGALAVLSGAYHPVRYGGRITDDEADRAEAALADLRAGLRALPPPADPAADSKGRP